MAHFPDLFYNVVGGGNSAFTPFDLAAARGLARGVSVVDVRGRCASVSTELIEVWDNGTEYIFPTGSLRLVVSSSDAADSASGQGMRTIRLDGLGLGFEQYSEVLLMNGTGSVQSTGSFTRLNHAHVATAGSHGGNRGVVRTHHGPLVLSVIASGSGHDSNAVYTVPSGAVAYVRGVYANTGKDATVRWRVAYRPVSGGLHTIRDMECYRTHIRFDLPFHPALLAGTDLIFSAQKIDGGATTATLTVGALLMLVDESLQLPPI